ncbi:hypothetical protein TL16_g06542 [Triparma laevis f. inornata]|uniref:Feruloyl esterase n=1 Tax=Triparma laevis f. inornata TaxID=1714386 RepID=A0A9W7ATC6_9STRA|nr:hypothetical protein TL16_g06542 [Triparma laevis f. inornata]
MRFTALTALAVVTAAPCSKTCSDEFVNGCVPYQNQGYQIYRNQIDGSAMPAPLSNAGCVKNCEDTDAMTIAKDDDGGVDTTCTLGAETFVANDEGSPTTLCSEQVCSLWSDRGTTACKILIDIPTTCAGKSGSTCPIIFFFHGAGGVDNQWNTGSQTGDVAEVDDVAFVISIMDDILSKYYGWSGSFFGYGHSNGAALVNKLAANGAGFHGLAAAATQLVESPESSNDPVGSNYLYNTIPNPKAKLVPMLGMHGDSDGTIPYDGGELFGGPYVLYSERDSQDIYAVLNGCTEDQTYTETTVGAVTDSGETSTATKYEYPCNVVGYKVAGGNHGVAQSIDGKSPTKVAMEFFKDIDGVVASELEETHVGDGGGGVNSKLGFGAFLVGSCVCFWSLH